MRFKELTEDVNDWSLDEMTATANLIKTNCQPFLKKAGAHGFGSLYRGIDSNSGLQFIKKNVRLGERDPVMMRIPWHNALNNYFEEKFGEPFRNSMLAIGDRNAAGTFGRAHFVFPAGHFTFLWSPDIADLNYYTEAKVHIPTPKTAPEIISDKRFNDYKSGATLIDVLEENVSYYTDDLQGAIESRNEIMFRCQYYYAVLVDVSARTGFQSILRKVLK
jgi:hypothetical protein